MLNFVVFMICGGLPEAGMAISKEQIMMGLILGGGLVGRPAICLTRFLQVLILC
jgi:hypothetical protein